MKTTTNFKTTSASVMRAVISCEGPLNEYVALVVEPDRSLPPEEQFYLEYFTDREEWFVCPAMKCPAYDFVTGDGGAIKGVNLNNPVSIEKAMELFKKTLLGDMEDENWDYRDTYAWVLLKKLNDMKFEAELKMKIGLMGEWPDDDTFESLN